MIDTLIDKQDNFELIRDQIAAILVSEVSSQMTKAVDAGKDPGLWKLRVFKERSNPWEQYQDSPTDRSPVVNVWYDNSSFDTRGSNAIERQKTEAIFNIDCYGYGVAKDDGTGHVPGDEEAALVVQRAIKLVRNILMAGTYTYLGMRGLVWSRWPQSINVFQPEMNTRSAVQVVGARVAMRVTFNEFSPQVEAETLEYLHIDVFNAADGELLLATDFDYTT